MSYEYNVNVFLLYDHPFKKMNMCLVKIFFKLNINKLITYNSEKNMENWNLQDQKLVSSTEDNLPATPKRKWEMLFAKTSSPSSAELPPTHTPLVVSNQIPEIQTLTSNKKRKRSEISPRSLIDQYLVSSSKQKKLDIVNKI